MAESFDYSTLNWVKGEIDATLDQARQALEAFVENPDDETQLRFCVTYLHQVHGTLKMVELYGAVMFAEEMEYLAQALLDNKIAQKEDAYEVLMRAILQLPDYLEKLQGGQRDVPVSLLSLLNDMRAICGRKLLSESAFFAPDLTVATPELSDTQPDADAAAEAKRLRHAFQMGLVGFFRERNVEKSLEQIASVIHSMRRVVKDNVVAQMFWSAAAVVEALRNEGLDATVSVKLLLGNVDRQLKKIIDGGIAALQAEPPTDLVKNLLYYAGTATSDGPLISEVREAFNLKELVTGTVGPAGADSGGLGGVNVEVMETVSAAVKEDLAHIKDQVDLYVRAENPEPATLEPLVDALKRVADTLGMLGLGTQRNVVVEQSAVVKDIAEGKLEANDETLMEMAGAFLFIESSLSDLSKGEAPNERHGNVVLRGLKRLQGDESETTEDETPASLMQESDQRDLLSAVVREAKADMARVKEAIVGFITAPWEHELLNDVPQLNRQIRGSMSMLSLEHAAGLLSAINDYIAEDLISKKDIPDQGRLDALADAITSIEYYLEAIDEQRSDSDEILKIAQRSLENLGHPVGEAAAEETAGTEVEVTEAVAETAPVEEALPEEPLVAEVEPVEELLPEEPVAVETTAEETGLDIDAELASGDPLLADAAGETAEVEELELSGEFELEEEPARSAVGEEIETEVEPPAAAAPPPAPTIMEDELDDEILEIFFEEATEEIANLNEHFPKWKANPEDQESMTTVRRSFHTLKGSGRMVGATQIGEYAWAFENMLNRVIDKTIPMSAEMFDLVTEGLAVLPELVDHFKGGPAPSADIEALQDRAHDMSKGGSGRLAEKPKVDETPIIASKETLKASKADSWVPPQSEVETGVEETEEAEAVKHIDPVLLEIFTKEATRHLDVINDFIKLCDSRGNDCRISEDLTRAVHTLHGSAHMASISDIAEVSSLLEKYIKLVQSNDIPVIQDARSLLTECEKQLRTRLSMLPDPDSSIRYKDDLLEKINALYDQELSREAEAKESQLQAAEVDISMPDIAEETVETGVDPELLEIFIEEGAEILDASEVTLQNWVNDADNKELVNQLQREIHTLKGGARMAEVKGMGDLSHSLETMIIAVSEGRVPVSKKMFDIIQLAHDKLVVMLEHVQRHQEVPEETALIEKIEALTAGKDIDELEAEEAAQEAESPEVEEVVLAAVEAPEVEEVVEAEPIVEEVAQSAEIIEIPDVVPAAEARKPAARPGRIQHEQIRVRADLLDNLVNFAGEVSIYRSRIEQQVGTFGYNLTEMDQTIDRLREQMRRFEIETEAQIMYRFEETGGDYDEDFDPLEMDRFSNMQQLSRSLLESLNDLSSIQGLLDNQTRETETLLLQQSRVNTELQEGLMRTRMVPFNTHLPRMRRLVRQTSNELKKQVDLLVSGEDAELDRTVLDRVMPPLEHMLRNAVDHGLESPAQREKAGKPETGRIHLDVSREGTEVVIRITDDGAGIDLDSIRKKAIERGLLNSKSDLTDKEILRFILESGFSTAKKVTQISGRGVGMDVVNSEIKQLGGTLQIDTDKGKGSRFTIRLPLTLSVNKALLVHVGEEVFAVPLSSVDSVVRVSYDELKSFYEQDNPRYQYAGNSYRFMHLGSLLGLNEAMLPSPGSKLPMLLVRAGDHRVALQIEGLMGSREIVVKSVGPQISSVRALSGATILGDGSVALILDMPSLVYMDVSRISVTGAQPPEEAQAAGKERVTTVMVVDDSITVRKVTTRLLERNGMHVVTAKDGVDAVSVLQETVPDVFLLDIEMPRMDGYELATHIRNDEKLKNIPIIMITSRTGDKHRQRAMDIGVNRYLGKPYQESDLLENINEILNESR
jgi:chemosensory pili system protein ChpA (sensor histidine kinase/response regulator)